MLTQCGSNSKVAFIYYIFTSYAMLGKHLSSLTMVSILASAVIIMLAGFGTFRNNWAV
jgi:hypothetical protein